MKASMTKIITQMKTEDEEEAAERIPTRRVSTAGSPTKNFRCPENYDDITKLADKMYNIQMDTNMIDPKYKSKYSGHRFSLRLETRECRCKCTGGKLCSDHIQKNVLYRSLFQANIVNQNGKLSTLCASVSSQDQHHCIHPMWKSTVFIPLEKEAVKKTKAEFKKYFQARTKSAKGVAKNAKCKAPPKSELKKKEHVPTDATWPTSPGHTSALTGNWPGKHGYGGDPGYGALARLTALLREETIKTGAALEMMGDLPKCYDHWTKKQKPCKFMVYTARWVVKRKCEVPNVKDSVVILLQHKDCRADACITVKVTKNPKGNPLVKGWSASAPLTKIGREAMATTPHNFKTQDLSNCIQWRRSNAWKLAADGIMRNAVAKFRFEVGQHLLKKTWFDGGFYPASMMGPCIEKGTLGYKSRCKDGPAIKPSYYISKSKLFYLCNEMGDQGHWGKYLRERQGYHAKYGFKYGKHRLVTSYGHHSMAGTQNAGSCKNGGKGIYRACPCRTAPVSVQGEKVAICEATQASDAFAVECDSKASCNAAKSFGVVNFKGMCTQYYRRKHLKDCLGRYPDQKLKTLCNSRFNGDGQLEIK